MQRKEQRRLINLVVAWKMSCGRDLGERDQALMVYLHLPVFFSQEQETAIFFSGKCEYICKLSHKCH